MSRLRFLRRSILVTALFSATAARAQTPATSPPAGRPDAASPPAASAPSNTAPTLAPAPTADDASAVRLEARPGRGISFLAGDAFGMTIRPRVQMRDTLQVDPTRTNEAQVRTLRLWFTGHAISPKTRYGIQLAFGANDFEAGSASPIFDAFVDLRHHRDLSVKIGQYFVPFDRMRTVRESTLETVDRAVVIQQLTLDRDFGVTLYSDDLGGHEGRFAYALGVFNGEGRNRFDAQEDIGFLYTARFAYRPFGSFDDDSEGDLERRTSPRLAIGVAFAYDDDAHRVRSTTGNVLTLGSVDSIHGAIDVSFKYRGFALLAEGVVRGSTTVTRSSTDAMGNVTTQVPSRGVGYVVQASYVTSVDVGFYTRWDEIRLPFTTDPALRTLVDARGRELSVGANYFLNGHSLKIQLDTVHAFGARFDGGTTVLRAQLDASF